MEHTTREACPSCGELTPIGGRACSFCRGNLLVGLVLEEPLDDERTAYKIARGLKDRWPDLDFVAAKQGLLTKGEPVISEVTREHAYEVASVLGAEGVVARPVHRPGPADSPSSAGPLAAALRRPLPWVAAALGTMIAVALFLGDGEPTPSPSPKPTARASADPAPPASADAGSEALGPVLTPRAISRQSLPSTVTMRCPESEGSGFFVGEDLVLTNSHVTCRNLEVELADGRRVDGVVESEDETLDIALVRLPKKLGTPLPLGDATRLEHGDRVVAIGNPLGLELTLTQGIVSHAVRNVMGVHYVQVDANINPGNSGGPLFDPQGRVAGIVSMTVGEATGLGLVLPINYLYEPPHRLLERPAGADTAAWRQRLAQIEDKDREEIAGLTAAFDRAGLLGAMVSRNHLVMMVTLPRFAEPHPQRFLFDFYREGEFLCSGSGSVAAWQEIGDAYLDTLDERTREWAVKNDLLGSLWTGATQVELDRGCAPNQLLGSEIWIDGAEPAPERRIVVTQEG